MSWGWTLGTKNDSRWPALKRQIVRFGVGGLTTTALCWGLLVFFVEKLHVHYLLSANLAGGIAYAYAYLINKYFVFNNYERKHVRQAGKFAAVQSVLWVLANAGMYAGVDVFGLHYLAATVIIAGLAAALNFLMMKLVVFA